VQVNEAIEPQRAAGKLGKSLDAAVTLGGAAGDETFKTLEKHRDFLAELFIVSHVTLAPAMGPAITADIRPCSELGFARCPRCWRWVPTLQPGSHGDVCPRCAEALSP
jgi:isoleucyl-tRNA synthetase